MDTEDLLDMRLRQMKRRLRRTKMKSRRSSDDLYKARSGKLRSEEKTARKKPFVLSSSDGMLYPARNEQQGGIGVARPESASSVASVFSTTSMSSLRSLEAEDQLKLPSIHNLGPDNGYGGFWKRLDQLQTKSWLEISNPRPPISEDIVFDLRNTDRISIAEKTDSIEDADTNNADDEPSDRNDVAEEYADLGIPESTLRFAAAATEERRRNSLLTPVAAMKFKHFLRRKSVTHKNHSEAEIKELIITEHRGSHHVRMSLKLPKVQKASKVVTDNNLVILEHNDARHFNIALRNPIIRQTFIEKIEKEEAAAATVIQQMYKRRRANRLGKLMLKSFAEMRRNSAVTTIASMHRCRKARDLRRFKEQEREEAEILATRQKDAVTKIQRVQRGHAARVTNERRRIAAAHIQKVHRGNEARKFAKKKKAQAAKLQRMMGESSETTKRRRSDVANELEQTARSSQRFFGKKKGRK